MYYVSLIHCSSRNIFKAVRFKTSITSLFDHCLFFLFASVELKIHRENSGEATDPRLGVSHFNIGSLNSRLLGTIVKFYILCLLPTNITTNLNNFNNCCLYIYPDELVIVHRNLY